MSQKVYNLAVSVVFSLVALIHLYRVVSGTDLILAGHALPMAFSVVGALVTGYLAIRGFQLSSD